MGSGYTLGVQQWSRKGCGNRIAIRQQAGVRGFTLLELMVAMGLLVMLIICVGVIFHSTTEAVGTSQVLLDQMDNIRTIERLLQRDVGQMDKRVFLVIRSQMLDPSNPNSPRFDQVSFLAHGSFPNRTGADDPVHPFQDNTVANAAHIWWGQLVMEALEPPNPSYMISNQSAGSASLPTGVYFDRNRRQMVVNEEQFVLGRHVTVLLPGPADDNGRIAPAGRVLVAYPSFAGKGTIQGAGESIPASIQSSRFAVATSLPNLTVSKQPQSSFFGSGPRTIQMGLVTAPVQIDEREAPLKGVTLPHPKSGQSAPNMSLLPQYDDEAVCFRFKALLSAYDTEVPENPFVNAAFRMQPIVMTGVSSVKIDWTDGKVNPKTGELLWYGPTNHGEDNIAEEYVDADQVTPGGDIYTATFAGEWPQFWPSALRFTYHMVDPAHRLASRDVVVVVSLPD